MGLVSDLVNSLKRGSKKDYVPGTLDEVLDRTCPVCGHGVHLAKMKPCCGSKNGYIWCKRCDYKEQIL